MVRRLCGDVVSRQVRMQDKGGYEFTVDREWLTHMSPGVAHTHREADSPERAGERAALAGSAREDMIAGDDGNTALADTGARPRARPRTR